MRLEHKLLLIVLLVFPAFAWAQPKTGDEILAQVDKASTSAADFTATVDLTTVEADKKTTKRQLNVWQKGTQKRMLKVKSPARLNGVGLLTIDQDQLYLYLPSFGRVRRVAGQKRGQSFLSTDFTQDDMVRTGYSKRFKAKLEKTEDDAWQVRLEPIKPDDEPYHHLVLTVRKADFVVAQVDFYADASTCTRKLLSTDIKTIGKSTIAHKIEAIDLKNKSRSTAILTKVQTDTGLEDSFFSERQLTRKR